MIVKVYEVYSKNQCVAFLTEQEAIQQEIFDEVDLIALSEVYFTDFEFETLQHKRYCWL